MKKNNKSIVHNFFGFTVLECLSSLVILAMICFFFTFAVKHTKTISTHLQSEDLKVWHIFMLQLERELTNTTYKKTEVDRIILKNKKTNNTIFVQFKLGKIVKVDNGGYQPLLMNVKHADFFEKNGVITIILTFESQHTVKAKWIID